MKKVLSILFLSFFLSCGKKSGDENDGTGGNGKDSDAGADAGGNNDAGGNDDAGGNNDAGTNASASGNSSNLPAKNLVDKFQNAFRASSEKLYGLVKNIPDTSSYFNLTYYKNNCENGEVKVKDGAIHTNGMEYALNKIVCKIFAPKYVSDSEAYWAYIRNTSPDFSTKNEVVFEYKGLKNGLPCTKKEHTRAAVAHFKWKTDQKERILMFSEVRIYATNGDTENRLIRLEVDFKASSQDCLKDKDGWEKCELEFDKTSQFKGLFVWRNKGVILNNFGYIYYAAFKDAKNYSYSTAHRDLTSESKGSTDDIIYSLKDDEKKSLEDFLKSDNIAVSQAIGKFSQTYTPQILESISGAGFITTVTPPGDENTQQESCPVIGCFSADEIKCTQHPSLFSKAECPAEPVDGCFKEDMKQYLIGKCTANDKKVYYYYRGEIIEDNTKVTKTPEVLEQECNGVWSTKP